MRKNLLCLVLSLVFISSVGFADDFDTTKDWSDFSNIDNAWDGQKSITNEEFEKTIKLLEDRKGITKKKAKKKFKGDVINNQDAGDYISNFQEVFPLLNLTVPINSPYGVIPVGHYKVVGTQKNGKIILNFCQAHKIVGKVPAVQTDDDFGEVDINFVKAEPYGNNYLKVMYGSMRFNAYAFLQY